MYNNNNIFWYIIHIGTYLSINMDNEYYTIMYIVQSYIMHIGTKDVHEPALYFRTGPSKFIFFYYGLNQAVNTMPLVQF